MLPCKWKRKVFHYPLIHLVVFNTLLSTMSASEFIQLLRILESLKEIPTASTEYHCSVYVQPPASSVTFSGYTSSFHSNENVKKCSEVNCL